MSFICLGKTPGGLVEKNVENFGRMWKKMENYV